MNKQCERYCQNHGIESSICIPQNNMNAHNLLSALFKLFDEQTVDKYELQDHRESVCRSTFDI